MAKSGVTPVVSIILLLLITISITGASWVFISSAFNSQTAGAFSVIFTTGSKVIIRNDGTQKISEITATLDGQSVNLKATPNNIEPAKTATLIPLAESLPIGRHALILCTSSICNNVNLVIQQPGSGRSCLEILDTGGSVGNGVYTIKPDGISSVNVYCDMSANDGGWTLAAVCKASESNNCWTTSAKGSVTDPDSATSTKLSDTNIKSILNGGEKITRTYWRQEYRYTFNDPVTAAVFNSISDPNSWSSNGCGGAGKQFFSKQFSENSITADIVPISKTAYANSWGSAIISESTGCSCAVNGWSNTRKDSCGFATWYASCESGPSMSHQCASGPERADTVVWVR